MSIFLSNNLLASCGGRQINGSDIARLNTGVIDREAWVVNFDSLGKVSNEVTRDTVGFLE